MPRVLAACLVPLALAALAWAGPAAGGEAPARIASINLCGDQLLVRLLAPERIASISHVGTDPHYSAVAEEAAGLPRNRGRAEEILAQDPDLVLAGAFGNRATVEMLRRLGYEVVQIAPPTDLAGVRRQLLEMSELLGVPQRGEALVADLDARLDALDRGAPDDRPQAVIFEPGGITLGSGGLPHAVIEAAALRNLAAERGIRGAGPLSLERLIVERPDILILHGDGDAPPSQAAALLNHPAMRHLRAETVVAVVPQSLWTCGGPEVIEAVERLAEARRRASEGTAP